MMRRLGFYLPLLVVLLPAPGVQAQNTGMPNGVKLSTTYTIGRKPLVAVRPAGGTSDLAIAQMVTGILQQDLDYSDRFQIGQTPSALAAGQVDYGQWNSLNVVYLVTSELSPAAQGYMLNIQLHDVPYSKVKQTQSFQLPAGNAPNFRMAVHAVSDELVRWMVGEPGSAASRIAFMRSTGGGAELIVVDSDGQNQQRVLTSPRGYIYSPAWSPDGHRIAYSVRNANEHVQLFERDLTTGTSRVISNRSVMAFTPAYSPDGQRLAFSFAIGNGSEIHDIDLGRGGAPRRITQSRWADASPTYSPDGRRIAFQSDRLGQPHIFVASAEGGTASALTPFGVGRIKFVAPDWSPTSNEIVFHGESQGGFHLMIVDANRPGTAAQITDAGSNEDPSWAPDGRHIVYTGVGSAGSGLYVIDRFSGRTRKLVSGDALKMPEWSGRLATPNLAAAGN